MATLENAIFHNNIEEVKSLIEAGADVNLRDQYGHTALYNAVYYGYSEIVKALIAAGADVNLVGHTALHRAAYRKYTEIFNLLIEKGVKVYHSMEYKWPVFATETHLQIGCQTHTYEEWESFTDEEIEQMSSYALEFWNMHKEELLKWQHMET